MRESPALLTYGNWQKYQNKNPLQRYLIRRFLETIVEMASRVKADTILDVGCAEGFVIQRLQETNSSLRIWGIDIDEEALRRGINLGLKSAVQLMDAHHLGLASESFDLILCLEVLEHLPEPRQALAEMKRVTRRYVLLSVPHEPFFRAINFLRGKHIQRWGNDPEHLHCWTEPAFKRLVAEQFRILEVRHPFPWLAVLAEKSQA